MIPFTGESGKLAEIIAHNSFRGRLFRFEATALRAGKHVPTSMLSLGGVYLMRDGCVLPPNITEQTTDGAFVFLSSRSGELIRSNGYSWRTASNSSPDFDPVSFMFSYCGDDEAATPADCAEDDWLQRGSAECLFTMHQLRCLPVAGSTFATSTERGVAHDFDLRVPREFLVLPLAALVRPTLPIIAMAISLGPLTYFGLFHSARRIGASAGRAGVGASD